ncbi:MAG: hypothetical protein FWH14_00485 [Oscillospiraceae bacterium]|nr:hypothetical protein [Oscillospiraceae bacterium]
MNEAAVAILLVSADFLASDFIRNVELPTLYKAEEESRIVIIPVMLYQCNSGDLMRYQYINTPDKPLGGLKKAKQEEVFARLSKVAVVKLDEYVEKSEILSRRIRENEERYRQECQRSMKTRKSPMVCSSSGTGFAMPFFGFFPIVAIISAIGAVIGAVIGGVVKKTLLSGLIGAGIGVIGIFVFIAVILLVVYLTSGIGSLFWGLLKGSFIEKKRCEKRKTSEWHQREYKDNYEYYRVLHINSYREDLTAYFADLFADSNFENSDEGVAIR